MSRSFSPPLSVPLSLPFSLPDPLIVPGPVLVVHELQDAGAHRVASLSPFCLKVHAALGASRLAFARAHGPFPAHWKALSGTGQVPVLVEDGRAINDSTAILARLVELSPLRLNAGLSAEQRGEALIVEEFADAELNGFLVAARWLDDDNWPQTLAAYFGDAPAPVRLLVAPLMRRRVSSALHARDVWRRGPAECWRRMERMLDALDARVPRSGFWFGDAFSTADAAIFGHLRSLVTALTPRQGRGPTARRLRPPETRGLRSAADTPRDAHAA